MPNIDIIVPVRNEEDNIPKFLEAFDALSLPTDVNLKVIFIEDGSTDSTVTLLRQLAKENQNIDYFSMKNGFGESVAIMFGISRSNADAMIMMAVESHPPELIPLMVQAFIDGAEVVQCIRDTLSGRPLYRDIGAAMFYPFIRILTGFDFREQNVYFRLISKNFAKSLLSSPRYWRFLRFPLPDDGSGAIRKIHADMSERNSGESKYYLGRLLGFAIDGILVWLSGPRMIALSLMLIGLAALLLRLNLSLFALLIVATVPLLSYRFYSLRKVNQVEKLIVEETNRESF